MIRPSFLLAYGLLHGCSSAPEVYRKDPNSFWINLVAQAVRDRSQGVFCSSVLRNFSPICRQPNAGVEKNDLPPRGGQHRQKALRKHVRRPNIGGILEIQILDLGTVEHILADDPRAMNENVKLGGLFQMPKKRLELFIGCYVHLKAGYL